MKGSNEAVSVQESYAEKYGIPRISMGEAAWHLEMFAEGALYAHPRHRGVPCFISDAGVGKTQLVHQVARKKGFRVVDLRTANFPLLSAGVPQRADENGMFRIAVPASLPKPKEKCILFFDEINQGERHAVAMFFGLIEDRVLFDYRLPDETLIVAAMNPATAQYMVTKLEGNAAVNRRLKKYFVYTTFGDFEKHARTKEFHVSDGLELPCHPWVLRYLNTDRSALYVHTAKDKGMQFPSPATWQTVSLDLYTLEHEHVALESERAEVMVAASIGMAHAKSLCEFIRNNEVRIAPEEIATKYKVKSNLRKRIRELAETEGGGVPDLTDNLAHYLFEEMPEPDTVASCLALFMSDLQPELMQGFYSQLRAAGSSRSGHEYMMRLTRALMQEDAYVQVNARLHQSFAEYEKGLGGGDGTPDPMAS